MESVGQAAPSSYPAVDQFEAGKGWAGSLTYCGKNVTAQR